LVRGSAAVVVCAHPPSLHAQGGQQGLLWEQLLSRVTWPLCCPDQHGGKQAWRMRKAAAGARVQVKATASPSPATRPVQGRLTHRDQQALGPSSPLPKAPRAVPRRPTAQQGGTPSVYEQAPGKAAAK